MMKNIKFLTATKVHKGRCICLSKSRW